MVSESDVDIDVPNREEVLKLIRHVRAMQVQEGSPRPHNSGIYVSPIPVDLEHQCATIDYKTAEAAGYYKLDILNVHVYTLIKSPAHYERLMSLPIPWQRLKDRKFVEGLIHLNRWYDTIEAQPEPIDSIPRLAMFLAAIRPAKKHLLGKPWKEIAETIWDTSDDAYAFKRSHSVSYAFLVALHMRILNDSE